MGDRMLNFDNVKIANYADSYAQGYIKVAIINIVLIILSVLIFRKMLQNIDKKPLKKNYDKEIIVCILSFSVFVASIAMLFCHKGPYLDVYTEVKPTNVLTVSEMKKQKEYFKEIDGKIYFRHAIDKIIIGSAKRIQKKDYIISETQEAFKEVTDPLWFDSKIE